MVEIKYNKSNSNAKIQILSDYEEPRYCPWEVWVDGEFIEAYEEKYYDYAVELKEMYEQGEEIAKRIKIHQRSNEYEK